MPRTIAVAITRTTDRDGAECQRRTRVFRMTGRQYFRLIESAMRRRDYSGGGWHGRRRFPWCGTLTRPCYSILPQTRPTT